MKKMKLDADSLHVATFPTLPDAARDARGTVDGHQMAATPTCPTFPVTKCPWSAFDTCQIYCD